MSDNPRNTPLNASPVQRQQQFHGELVPRLYAVDFAALLGADLQTFCATKMADLAVYGHFAMTGRRRLESTML